MKQTSSSYLLSLLLLSSNLTFAQVPVQPVAQWGISAGTNEYKESSYMKLKGLEMGLHVRAHNFSALPQLNVEGDAFFGQQRYTSTNTGSMDGVHNIETRWRALMPIYANTPSQHGLFAGVGVHTLWNDLRGTSSTGNAGYERSATQLWIPVRWVSNFWELEAGALVYGKHTSKLSQTGSTPALADIVNTQNKGAYLQGRLNVQMDERHTLSPYLRYTDLADSDLVARGYEPASTRWQTGVTWQFTTP